MLQVQRLREWHQATALDCRPGAAGYVSTSDRFGSIPLVHHGHDGSWLVITGVPIVLAGSLDTTVSQLLSLPFDGAIERLQSTDGAFAAIYWNNTVRKLAIVTDILGMQPLFLYETADVFAVASDAKALTACGLMGGIEMDPAGWGAFVALKHPIAGRSLVSGVRRVPPASVLVFDPESRSSSCRSYWRWPEPVEFTAENVPTAEIAATFVAELEAFLSHNRRAKLCLSGGFDSRLILAALAEIGHVPETMLLSHTDELFDVDGRLARRIARSFGAEFTVHDSDPSFYSSAGYYDYLVASEVATPSLYLFIAQLCSKLDASMEAIWEGAFPGCILYPVHQPPGGFTSYLKSECAPLDSIAWKAAARVFRADLIDEMKAAFTSCLKEEMGKYTDDEFGVSQFVVRNRTRQRIAMNPLQIYSNDVMPLTPGISKRFWSVAAAIPYRLRAGHRLYIDVFKKCFPKALGVPAISGTTPYALNTRRDRHFLLAHLGLRARQSPKLAAALAVAGYKESYWEPSSLVKRELRERIDWGHSDLHVTAADNVEAKNGDPVVTRAQELLFYWNCWRRIHTGNIQPS